MTSEIKPYRVLALDGGGIRGLYTSTVLHEVGAFFAKQRGDSDLDIGERFDLITGTSTGGILACGLAAGVTPQRISDLYKEEGPKIFRNPMPTAGFLAKASYGKRAASQAANKAEPLRKALFSVFGDETLGALYKRRGIAVCLPSIKMITQASKVFKTPHNSDLVIDLGYKLVDVCLATSAAPIFLPLAQLEFPDSPGRVELFADGGLWANNPTLIGLIEALKICFDAEGAEGARRPVEILSIGTCGLPEGEAPDAKADRGILDWAVGIKIAGLAMNAQASAAACMATILAQRVTELGRSVRIVRIDNPPVSAEQAKHLQLDLATADALSLLAQLGSQKAQQVMSDAGDRSNPNGQFIRNIFTT
jgi:hypothetical protein